MDTGVIAQQVSGPVASACQSCRVSKRRCNKDKPQCSTCKRNGKECVYEAEAKPRKRKYWDEDYVRSLEDQVQALLALQQNAQTSQALPDIPESTVLGETSVADVAKTSEQDWSRREKRTELPDDNDRSSMAMEELSVMLWRTNLGDAVTVVNDAQEQIHTPSPNVRGVQVPGYILMLCENLDRLHILASLYLDYINGEHQFTQYASNDFLRHYPYQPMDRLFLHSAILAAGATFEQATDSLQIGDALAEFSESLIFSCFRHASSVSLIQGLCILSWRSLALGRDHFGWVFLSMAAGMAVHLRLHVLALDEMALRPAAPAIEDIQTFWSFYMTDRTSISILGRHCVLPWRRVNVPAIEAVFANTQDLKQISFAWQCKLWHMHDKNMDQIFSSTFDKFSFASQVELLISTHEELNNFFKACNERLRMTRAVTPKPVLLFHMAYQMAILVTMPPFLRLFTQSNNRSQDATNAMSLVLRSISNAASSMVRLVHLYRRDYTFRHANPLLIHHLLSAAIVHLMNTTSKSVNIRRHSMRSVRRCIGFLQELNQAWPVRCTKSIDVIESLAGRWGVESIIQPETKISLADDNSGNNAPHEYTISNLGSQRELDIDIMAAQDILEPEIDLGTEQEYNFTMGHDTILPVGDINIFQDLAQMADLDDLNWVFQG